MLSDEEKISLNRMKLFARSSNLSVVTAKDMNIVVTLVEKQSKEIEELKEKNENLLDALNNSIDIRKYWVSKDKIKAKIEEIDLAVFKNQTIYTVNKMQEIKFARLCLAELLEKE